MLRWRFRFVALLFGICQIDAKMNAYHNQILPPVVVIPADYHGLHTHAQHHHYQDEQRSIMAGHLRPNGNCSVFEQTEIRKCAEPLYQIGAFRQAGDGFEFTWEYFVSRTKEYFSQVCDNFFIFDICIEPFKESCFTQEPVRSRYQAAVKILDFLCRDGYTEMVRNFECFTRTLTRAEMMQCQTELISDSRKVPSVDAVGRLAQEAAICGAVRNYIDCVKYPIRYECGYRAWYVVREVLIRPTVMMMPQCDIAGAATIRLSLATMLVVVLTWCCNVNRSF